MSGKFGVAFILACTLLVQAVFLNASGNRPVENPAAQNPAVVNNAVSSPCSVDQNFNVSTGVSKPDANFGVNIKTTQPGVDAGFQAPVCKGVPVPDPNAQGGQPNSPLNGQ